MATKAESTAATASYEAVSGRAKLFSDIYSVFEIKFMLFIRGWYWFLIGTVMFPVGIFYFATALAPDTEEAVRRAMTGTIVFGATMMTTNILASGSIQDRFQGRLKLIITMPVSKAAYTFGLLGFGAMLTVLVILVLLGVAVLAGVDFKMTWAFLPIVAAVILAMSGLTLFIVSYAPSAEVGGVMSNLLGVFMTFVSPVYFPSEQAPIVMRMFGWISPFKYAADGMMKTFSGSTDVWAELTILTVLALASMALGIWRFRWREA